MNADAWLAKKEEWDELHSLSQAIGGALQDAREPRVICAAFASGTRGLWAFTLQVWIDLAAVSSPILDGGEFTSAEQLTQALAAFGYAWPEDGTPEDALSYTESMREAVALGFATRLGMRESTLATEEGEPQGFGEWLPLFTFVVAECGVSPDAAKAMWVCEAFALAATRRHLQGWKVAGTPYALREIAQAPTEDATRA